MKANPTFLITGASTGIGEALVYALGSKFARPRLILASRNIRRLQEIKKKLIPKSEVVVFKCDVSDGKSVQQLIKKSYLKFKTIDVFILNAGISMWNSFREIGNVGILKEIMKTNYLGIVYPLHFAFKNILRDRSKVVVVSSAQSFIPLPYHSGYVASKYAVNGFLDTLRQEEKNISITEVMFGWVRGTNLRKNALGKKNLTVNKSNKKKHLFAVELKEAVASIMGAINSKKKVIFAPPMIAVIPLIKVLLPSLLYYIIRKITHSEAKQ